MLAGRLFVRSASAVPSLRETRYGWIFNSMRSLHSTRRPERSLCKTSEISVIVPFSDYKDVVLVSRIQGFLDRQRHLEQDLKESDLDAILGTAIEMQKQDVVQFLLNKGADPNGWSYCLPICHLAQAAQFENLEITSLLLDHGAFPHACGALWMAAATGNIALAEALIGQGADVNEIVSPKICDGLDYHEDHFRLGQLKAFLEEMEQGTPLHAAACEDQADMVKFLLERGANKAILDGRGMTAADIVKENMSGPPDDQAPGWTMHERRSPIFDMLK